MAEVLDKLQVYGMSRDDEAVYLACLLTGEPPLLICSPGSAKTTLMRKTAKALKVKGAVYNMAQAQFEDMIGFLDVGKLQQGEVNYIETPVTIWNKPFVGTDEANRPLESNSNKWLEFLGDGTMMGKHTGVRWKVGAMNPYGTEGTSQMGSAMLGRFSAFIFVPELLSMSSGDQEAVIKNISEQNLPAMSHWAAEDAPEVQDTTDYDGANKLITAILRQASDHYLNLRQSITILPRFLSRLAMALAAHTVSEKENDATLRIDGRRAGFLYRLILAIRAVELARANVLHLNPKSFAECARLGIRYGLPIGVNSEGGRSENALTKVETVFTTMLPFLSGNKDLAALEIQFELLTSTDIFRKTQILLEFGDRLDRIVQSAAWTRITSAEGFNAALVGFIANQIEVVRPKTIPPDVLDGMTKMMNGHELLPRSFAIPPQLRDHESKLQELLDQPTLLGKLIATHLVTEFAGREMLVKRESDAAKVDLEDLALQVRAAVKNGINLGKTVDEMLKQ